MRGDIQVYAHLVTRYQTPIYNLMLRMCRSREQAGDLTQETFVHAFEKLATYDPERAFFPWLYTVGLNVARDHLRRHKNERQATLSLDVLLGNGEEPRHPDEPYDRAMDRRLLSQALAELPDDMREALLLRFREECSYVEIAAILQIGLSNAKMKIHRGLERIRQTLLKEPQS